MGGCGGEGTQGYRGRRIPQGTVTLEGTHHSLGTSGHLTPVSCQLYNRDNVLLYRKSRFNLILILAGYADQICFQEVEALTMFKHRNIVSLLGIGICDGQPKYILMEYMNEVKNV